MLIRANTTNGGNKSSECKRANDVPSLPVAAAQAGGSPSLQIDESRSLMPPELARKRMLFSTPLCVTGRGDAPSLSVIPGDIEQQLRDKFSSSEAFQGLYLIGSKVREVRRGQDLRNLTYDIDFLLHFRIQVRSLEEAATAIKIYATSVSAVFEGLFFPVSGSLAHLYCSNRKLTLHEAAACSILGYGTNGRGLELKTVFDIECQGKIYSGLKEFSDFKGKNLWIDPATNQLIAKGAPLAESEAAADSEKLITDHRNGSKFRKLVTCVTLGTVYTDLDHLEETCQDFFRIYQEDAPEQIKKYINHQGLSPFEMRMVLLNIFSLAPADEKQRIWLLLLDTCANQSERKFFETWHHNPRALIQWVVTTTVCLRQGDTRYINKQHNFFTLTTPGKRASLILPDFIEALQTLLSLDDAERERLFGCAWAMKPANSSRFSILEMAKSHLTSEAVSVLFPIIKGSKEIWLLLNRLNLLVDTQIRSAYFWALSRPDRETLWKKEIVSLVNIDPEHPGLEPYYNNSAFWKSASQATFRSVLSKSQNLKVASYCPHLAIVQEFRHLFPN